MKTDAHSNAHQSPGSPDGGKFAAVQKPEANVSLAGEDVWFMYGKYYTAQRALDQWLFSAPVLHETVERFLDGIDRSRGPENTLDALALNAERFGYDPQFIKLPRRADDEVRIAIAEEDFRAEEYAYRVAETARAKAAVTLLGAKFRAKYPEAESVVVTFEDGDTRKPFLDSIRTQPADGGPHSWVDEDANDRDIAHRCLSRIGNILRALDAGLVTRAGEVNSWRVDITDKVEGRDTE